MRNQFERSEKMMRTQIKALIAATYGMPMHTLKYLMTINPIFLRAVEVMTDDLLKTIKLPATKLF